MSLPFPYAVFGEFGRLFPSKVLTYAGRRIAGDTPPPTQFSPFLVARPLPPAPILRLFYPLFLRPVPGSITSLKPVFPQDVRTRKS